MRLSTGTNCAKALVYGICTFILTGCLESGKFVWSPDGSEAALCANDGLRFCDAKGALTDTQLKSPDELAWHRDGKRLFIITHMEAQSWDDLAMQLPSKRQELVEGQAQLFLKYAQQKGMTAADFGKQLHDKITRDAINEILLFLKAKHDIEMKSAFGKDWTEYTVSPATLYTLASYRRDGDKLVDEKTLWKSTKPLNSPKASPVSEAIIVVHDSRNLYLLDPPNEPQLLAVGVSRHPDWSSDGKFVYFFLESENEKAPGTISRLAISDFSAAGSANKAPAAIENLATMQFYKDARVRCLPDGGLLAATAVATAKSRPDIFGRKTVFLEKFYRFQSGSSTPKQLAFTNEFINKCGYCSFEASPSGTKVILATENGSIKVISLPGGAAKDIARDNSNPSPFAPCWRSEEEICFAQPVLGSNVAREVILFSLKNNAKQTLSAEWPRTATEGLLVKEEEKQNRFEDFLNSLYQ